jgi:V/A-type H+-transporting ATPase subunit C
MSRLDFVNARLRARRSRLLGADDVRELLTRPTTEARLELVARRAGSDERAARSVAAAEALLLDRLHAESVRILAQVEGAAARRALAAALAVDDAAVVKAALRAVLAGGSVERAVAAALPSPTLAPATARAIVLARTPEALAGALAATGHPLALPLRAALARTGPRTLARLELAIDAAALDAARSRAGSGTGEDAAVVREHVALRIDARNAATLLVLTGADAAPLADGFVPGGARFEATRFRVLATGPREAARAAVAAAFRGIGAALARPWTAERALAREVLGGLRRAARDRPLSVAVPLLYLAERQAELRRIRVILRGAELALPGDDLLALAEA